MKKTQLTKSNIICLSFAGVFCALAVFLAVFAGKIGLVHAITDGEPEIAVKSFLNSIISADYDTAVYFLNGCTKLNLENPNAGENSEPDAGNPDVKNPARLYDSLLDSFSYKLNSVNKSGINATVNVDFSGLNLPYVEDNIKKDAEEITEKLAQELSYDFVYDESRNFTADFVQKVLETVLDKIGEAPEYRMVCNLNLELIYSDGEWLIKQTPELIRVLSGGTIKDKQAAEVLNLSGTIGKSVERIITTASGELYLKVATPTPTPTPSGTPSPVPTLPPGVSPTPRPLRKSTAKYTLDEYDRVAPKPDKTKYGSTTKPADILKLLETEEAKNLLKGQEVAFKTDLNFEKNKKIHYYLDETILVIVWSEKVDSPEYEDNTAFLTFAEVVIADGSQLRRKLSGDAFGSGIELKASEMAKSANAVVTIGGDFYGYKNKGVVVFEHKVCRDIVFDNTESCFFRTDGEMLFTRAGYFKSTEEVQQFVDDNDISFGVTFGPILVDNHYVIKHDSYPLGESFKGGSRSVISMMDVNHYLLLEANWTFTTNQIADIIGARGVEKAYALDGGQTAELYFNGKVHNHISFNEERVMTDIIYFATAVPEE